MRNCRFYSTITNSSLVGIILVYIPDIRTQSHNTYYICITKKVNLFTPIIFSPYPGCNNVYPSKYQILREYSKVCTRYSTLKHVIISVSISLYLHVTLIGRNININLYITLLDPHRTYFYSILCGGVYLKLVHISHPQLYGCGQSRKNIDMINSGLY